MIEDTQAVGMFYRFAKTDSDFLRTFGASMVTALAPHMREKAGALVPLAMALQALLVRQSSWEDARAVLLQIDALAAKHDVNLSHPLVTCAVSCLYGSGAARGVLKPAVNPTDTGAYNAVADIRLVMETAYIRRMWDERRSRESVRLYSGDKHLNAFSRMLEVRVSASLAPIGSGKEIVSFTSTMSQNLLPNLRTRPKEMDRVLDHLRASRDGDHSILASQ
jgi:hypothetical protein